MNDLFKCQFKISERRISSFQVSHLDKASQFSLENLLTDVKEVERGMEVTRVELEKRLGNPNANKVRPRLLSLNEITKI